MSTQELNQEVDQEVNPRHELLGDIQALATEAATVLGDAATGKATADGIATLRAQFEVAQAHFLDVYEEAKDKTTKLVKRADQAVRENPYQEILIVSGLALIAGIFIGRATKSS